MLPAHEAERADSDSRADVDDSLEWQPSSPSLDSTRGNSGAFILNSASLAEDDEDEAIQSDDGEPTFCTNCTSRLYGTDICDDCGHCARDDARLFDEHPSCSGRSLDDHALTSLSAYPFAPYPMSALPSFSPAALALCFDERMALHEEGKLLPHPERPDRIRAVIARIKSSGLSGRCQSVPCREATLEEIKSCHDADLCSFLEAHCQGETALPPGAPGPITSDTYVNRHTFLCARLAAGAAAEVATRVARGQALNGAAIIRPPGHHAESNMIMGFCFFNNAAIAARAAQAAGARRVVIFDWDVHHGNGTQHIFEDDPSVLYVSLHRYDHGTFYPGTGAVHEVGVAQGAGYTVNIPWNHDEVSNNDYMAAFHHVVLPVVTEFAPDLIILSAGFDAAEGDPIGGCRLTPECYAHMAALLRPVAPVVALLEGGYNLLQTARSTEATLWALLEGRPPPLPGPRTGPSPAATRSIQDALRMQAQFWPCLRPALVGLSAASPPGVGGATGGYTTGDEDDDVEYLSGGCAGVGNSCGGGLPRRTRQELQRAAMTCATRGSRQPSGAAGSGQRGSRGVGGPRGGVRKRPGAGARASGGLVGLVTGGVPLSSSHKRRIMMAIHRRALHSFWKWRRNLMGSTPSAH